MSLTLNVDLPLKGGVQKSVRNGQPGWEKFATLTEEDSALADCWSVEVSYRTWEKRLDSLMHKSFKKRRVRTKN